MDRLTHAQEVSLVMNFLTPFTRTDGNRFAYLVRAWIVMTIGTFLSVALVIALIPTPDEVGGEAALPRSALSLILLIIWPLIITGLIWGVATIAMRHLPTYWHVSLVTAVIFTLVISLWIGVHVALFYTWAVYIAAIVFLAWQLHSTTDGLVMCFGVLSLLNISPLLLAAMASAPT